MCKSPQKLADYIGRVVTVSPGTQPTDTLSKEGVDSIGEES